MEFNVLNYFKKSSLMDGLEIKVQSRKIRLLTSVSTTREVPLIN